MVVVLEKSYQKDLAIMRNDSGAWTFLSKGLLA